jgi:hypothetical protein
MDEETEKGPLLARCVVCRGNIRASDEFEIWDGGYYCRRHSLAYLRARAEEYAVRQRMETPAERPG